MDRRVLLAGVAAAGLAMGGVAWRMTRDEAAWREALDALRRPLAAEARGAAARAELVRMATLAANSHNTQPWRFVADAESISILPDFQRRCPVVDPDDHHVFASLGAAAETIVQAAPLLGLAATVRFDAQGDGRVVVALRDGTVGGSALAEAIPLRQCTRGPYDGRAVPAAELRMLAEAGAVDGVEVRLVTERPAMEAIATLVLDGNRAQMTDPLFMAELKDWIRFDHRTAVARRDGLFAACSGNPVVPDLLGRAMFGYVVTAEGENRKYAAQIAGSAGLAVFVAATDDRAGWMAAGRGYQRFALQATALGVRHAFVNQAVEVPAQRAKLVALMGLRGRPNLVVRFGYGPGLPMSLRRPVAEVLADA